MSEFTKGEWKIKSGADKYSWYIRTDKRIALLEGYGCSEEESKANACLISASPIGAELAEFVMDCPIDARGLTQDEWRMIVTKAREFQAKAKGKQ